MVRAVKRNMTRRDAAWMIFRAASAAGGAEFFDGWMRAGQAQSSATHAHETNSGAPPEPDRWTSYKPKFFSPTQFEILDAFTAILIPTDDTPGAREAHVACFIDFVVEAAGEYAPEMQKQWRDALSWLESQKFASRTPKEQLALVEELSMPERGSGKRDYGYSAYRLVKDMAVYAFYTSRVGLVDVLEYKGLAYLTQFPACEHPEHHQV